MTNAVGHYHHSREELLNTTHSDFTSNPHKAHNKISYDINRDFPYNNKADQCLNTIAGRVIHQLFVENVIVSSITFHGGTNVIGYPWGSFNRVRKQYDSHGSDRGYKSMEAPDFQAFESVGWIMKNETGGPITINGQQSKKIQEY